MVKEDYIAQHKKDGLILVKHTKMTDKDGEAIFQYAPQGTLPAMIEHDWVVVADVPTPPESINVQEETTQETEATEQPIKRGRKPKTA